MRGVVLILLSFSLAFAQSIADQMKQAQIYEEKKAFEEAVTIYKNVLTSREINKQAKFDIYLKIADLEYEKLGRPDSAIKYLEMARKEYSDVYRRMDEVFYRLGLACEKKGDYQKAAEAYQVVAVRFQKSRYIPDALDGVERVFRKNFKDYVAFVGEEPITRLELERELETVPPFSRSEFETPEGKQKLLRNIIQRRLLAKEAENRKLYLKSSYQEEMNRAREQALIRALYNEIQQNVSVNEKEIKEYYEKNKDSRYKVPAKVTYRAIVVDDSLQADSVYKFLSKGESFDSLFDKYNTDKQLKITKGLKKDVAMGSQPEEVVKTAFTLKVGQISKPIKIEKENKYAVIIVDNKTPETYRNLEEVSEEIRRILQNQKVRQTWENLIDTLWQKYHVRILLNESEK